MKKKFLFAALVSIALSLCFTSCSGIGDGGAAGDDGYLFSKSVTPRIVYTESTPSIATNSIYAAIKGATG